MNHVCLLMIAKFKYVHYWQIFLTNSKWKVQSSVLSGIIIIPTLRELEIEAIICNCIFALLLKIIPSLCLDEYMYHSHPCCIKDLLVRNDVRTSEFGISQDPVKKTDTTLCLFTKEYLSQRVNYTDVLDVCGLMH